MVCFGEFPYLLVATVKLVRLSADEEEIRIHNVSSVASHDSLVVGVVIMSPDYYRRNTNGTNIHFCRRLHSFTVTLLSAQTL